MQRLLHGFRQWNAAAGSFYEITGSKSVGRKLRRVQPGLLDAGFQDKVDGLRRHRSPVKIAPLVDTPKGWTCFDLCLCQPIPECRHRPADQDHMLVVIR